MTKIFGMIGTLIYGIIGLYLLNFPFQIVPIPEFISNFDKWIIFVGGILVIIGGIKYLFSSKKHDVSL